MVVFVNGLFLLVFFLGLFCRPLVPAQMLKFVDCARTSVKNIEFRIFNKLLAALNAYFLVSQSDLNAILLIFPFNPLRQFLCSAGTLFPKFVNNKLPALLVHCQPSSCVVDAWVRVQSVINAEFTLINLKRPDNVDIARKCLKA